MRLLNYQVQGCDVTLEGHLKDHVKNASYVSKTTQNELSRCCGQYITEQVVSEVKKSKYYAIIADETCDISCKEQMPLVSRFIDSDINIRKEFFRFIQGLVRKNLASVILKFLNEDLCLDVNECR